MVCSPNAAIRSLWALTPWGSPQHGRLVLHSGGGIQRTWWGSFGSTQTPGTWEVWAEQSDDLNWCFYNKNLNKEQKCVQGRGRGAVVKIKKVNSYSALCTAICSIIKPPLKPCYWKLDLARAHYEPRQLYKIACFFHIMMPKIFRPVCLKSGISPFTFLN